MTKVVRVKTLQCVADNGDRFALDVSRQWLHQKSLADEPLTFCGATQPPPPRMVSPDWAACYASRYVRNVLGFH